MKLIIEVTFTKSNIQLNKLKTFLIGIATGERRKGEDSSSTERFAEESVLLFFLVLNFEFSVFIPLKHLKKNRLQSYKKSNTLDEYSRFN